MKKKLLILPAIAVGVLVVVLLQMGKRGPSVAPPSETARPVRVLEIRRLPLTPRAVGYGEARPGRVWQAVAEVGGRIVTQSPRLREGNFLQGGAEIVAIDSADYDLEVAQANAQIQSIDAQTGQLDARAETLRSSLEIEERSHKLAQAELERIRKLVSDGTLTPADLDREERTVLNQRVRVTEIQNALRLIEPERKVLAAQRKLEESRLGKAKLAVARTVIHAPFDCRVGTVNVEQGQVVQAGQTLFHADGIDSSEVTANLPLVGVRELMAAPEAIDVLDLDEAALEKRGLSAIIRLQAGQARVRWDARVVRVRGIDSQTRTIGIDVSVSEPYKNLRPGLTPPLIKGMYVEVEVRGRPRADQILVPRTALRDGRVHVVDEDGRLEIRPVEVAFVQSRLACIRAGLEVGDLVVLTDLAPAVNGMRIAPERDDAAFEALRADAAAETRVR